MGESDYFVMTGKMVARAFPLEKGVPEGRGISFADHGHEVATEARKV